MKTATLIDVTQTASSLGLACLSSKSSTLSRRRQQTNAFQTKFGDWILRCSPFHEQGRLQGSAELLEKGTFGHTIELLIKIHKRCRSYLHQVAGIQTFSFLFGCEFRSEPVQ